jgi:hypothetical protein
LVISVQDSAELFVGNLTHGQGAVMAVGAVGVFEKLSEDAVLVGEVSRMGHILILQNCNMRHYHATKSSDFEPSSGGWDQRGELDDRGPIP